jgi:hypothetical protein
MDHVLPPTGTAFRNQKGEVISGVWWVDGSVFCLQVTIVDTAGLAKSIVLDLEDVRELGQDLYRMTKGVIE